MDIHSANSFMEAASLGILTNPSNGIIGLAIGRKHGGPITRGGSEYCITAFVVRRLEPDERDARGIPDAYEICNQAATTHLRRALSPQDVNVVETGDVFRLDASYTGSSHAHPASANTQKWFSKLRPGIGIANPTRTYPDTLVGGTCGLFAKRTNADGTETVYLVSCNHVIARSRTSERPLIHGHAVHGETVIQPASMDLAGSDISRLGIVELGRDFGIGTLSAFEEVHVYLPGNTNPHLNLVDAALAVLSGDRGGEHVNLCRLPYGGRFTGEHEYQLDDNQDIQGSAAVFKCGRTSGYTEGEVTEINGRFPTDFAMKKAIFDKQLMIRPSADNTGRFSEPGDSGSAVVTDEHKVVGMVIGSTPTRSAASPIKTVLGTLSLALDAAGVPIGTLKLYISP
jgi:hypothetical protein